MSAFPSKWIFTLLGAAIVSLACAIVGMFVARERLLEASDWVSHTSEVELSILACRLHIREAQTNVEERPAALAVAWADAERIARLTVDNPTQQVRLNAFLPRLRAFAGDAVGAGRMDASLRELEAAESSLKDARTTTLRRTTRTGWLVISVSATLTVLFVVIILLAFHGQSRALRKAQISLRREAAMLESIMDSMVDGIMAISPKRDFLHINRAARRLLGDDFPADAFPKDWRSKLACVYEDGTSMKPEDGALARAITGASTDNLVYQVRQANNPEDPGTWVSATARPVRDADGTIIAGVVSLRDVSEQKRQRDLLHAMSMSDELTGLHNRRGFLMLAEQHARVAQRQGIPFGIVFADLNGLKLINDSLGHEAGDRSIRSTADILRHTFRDSDIIARLGGDEFVALLVNTDATMHDAIAARVRNGLSGHNAHETPARHLSLSLGITFFDPEHPLTVPVLIVEADRRMYADKREGRSLRS